MWKPSKEALLQERKVHHLNHFWCLGWWKQKSEHHILSYAYEFLGTDPESVETQLTVQT